MTAREPADAAFADCPDRRGTGSEKWDRYAGRDVLPVWVADMDFRSPPEVLAAMGHRGRRWVAEECSWDRVAAEMHQLYAWLLSHGDRPACLQVSA